MPGQALAIVVDLAPKEGQPWVGAISIPAQNLKGFPLSDITVAGNAVGFGMKGVPGDPRFKGTLSADGKSIAGELSQGGGVAAVHAGVEGRREDRRAAEEHRDHQGAGGLLGRTARRQGIVLHLVLKLANQPGGATGVLVSVDQGGAEIPVTSITQTGSQLKFTITTINAGYTGDLKDGQLTGTWSQGPGSWPLVFKRPAK